MARIRGTLVIVISLSFAFTLSFSFGFWGFFQANVADPILDPRVEISSLGFSERECEPVYFLWFIPNGEHRIVVADLILANEGATDGRAVVVFTVDGAQVDDHAFYIAAGQEESKTYQFQAGDCDDHIYSAYLGDVVRA